MPSTETSATQDQQIILTTDKSIKVNDRKIKNYSGDHQSLLKATRDFDYENHNKNEASTVEKARGLVTSLMLVYKLYTLANNKDEAEGALILIERILNNENNIKPHIDILPNDEQQLFFRYLINLASNLDNPISAGKDISPRADRDAAHHSAVMFIYSIYTQSTCPNIMENYWQQGKKDRALNYFLSSTHIILTQLRAIGFYGVPLKIKLFVDFIQKYKIKFNSSLATNHPDETLLKMCHNELILFVKSMLNTSSEDNTTGLLIAQAEAAVVFIGLAIDILTKISALEASAPNAHAQQTGSNADSTEIETLRAQAESMHNQVDINPPLLVALNANILTEDHTSDLIIFCFLISDRNPNYEQQSIATMTKLIEDDSSDFFTALNDAKIFHDSVATLVTSIIEAIKALNHRTSDTEECAFNSKAIKIYNNFAYEIIQAAKLQQDKTDLRPDLDCLEKQLKSAVNNQDREDEMVHGHDSKKEDKDAEPEYLSLGDGIKYNHQQIEQCDDIQRLCETIDLLTKGTDKGRKYINRKLKKEETEVVTVLMIANKLCSEANEDQEKKYKIEVLIVLYVPLATSIFNKLTEEDQIFTFWQLSHALNHLYHMASEEHADENLVQQVGQNLAEFIFHVFCQIRSPFNFWKQEYISNISSMLCLLLYGIRNNTHSCSLLDIKVFTFILQERKRIILSSLLRSPKRKIEKCLQALVYNIDNIIIFCDEEEFFVHAKAAKIYHELATDIVNHCDRNKLELNINLNKDVLETTSIKEYLDHVESIIPAFYDTPQSLPMLTSDILGKKDKLSKLCISMTTNQNTGQVSKRSLTRLINKHQQSFLSSLDSSSLNEQFTSLMLMLISFIEAIDNMDHIHGTKDMSTLQINARFAAACYNFAKNLIEHVRSDLDMSDNISAFHLEAIDTRLRHSHRIVTFLESRVSLEKEPNDKQRRSPNGQHKKTKRKKRRIKKKTTITAASSAEPNNQPLPQPSEEPQKPLRQAQRPVYGRVGKYQLSEDDIISCEQMLEVLPEDERNRVFQQENVLRPTTDISISSGINNIAQQDQYISTLMTFIGQAEAVFRYHLDSQFTYQELGHTCPGTHLAANTIQDGCGLFTIFENKELIGLWIKALSNYNDELQNNKRKEGISTPLLKLSAKAISDMEGLMAKLESTTESSRTEPPAGPSKDSEANKPTTSCTAFNKRTLNSYGQNPGQSGGGLRKEPLLTEEKSTQRSSVSNSI